MNKPLVKVSHEGYAACLTRIKFLFGKHRLFVNSIKELKALSQQKALSWFYLPNGYGGEDGLLAVSASAKYSNDQPDLMVNFMYCQRPHYFQNLIKAVRAIAKAGKFRRVVCEVPNTSRVRLYQRVGFQVLDNDVDDVLVMEVG